MSSHYKCRVAAKSGPVRTCRLPRAPRLPSACQTLRQEVRDSRIAIHVHAAPPRAAPVRRSTQDPALLTLILHPSISQKASSRATPRALAAPPRAMATETLPVSPRFPSRTAASVGRWGQRPEVDVRPSSSPKGKKVRDQRIRHLQGDHTFILLALQVPSSSLQFRPCAGPPPTQGAGVASCSSPRRDARGEWTALRAGGFPRRPTDGSKVRFLPRACAGPRPRHRPRSAPVRGQHPNHARAPLPQAAPVSRRGATAADLLRPFARTRHDL